MVVTKHFVIHSAGKLKQSEEYIENAEKTLVDLDKSLDHFENIFPYIINENKTRSKQLVSGYGITDIYNMAEEFTWTKLLAARLKGNDDVSDLTKANSVLAHHLIQSFSPEDKLTPEEIHEIGRQTVLELTGGEYEFVIATHVDKAHIHNHILINSTNRLTHRKFRWQKNTLKVFRAISDKHAAYAGAKIIEPSLKNSHTRYSAWQAEAIFKTKIKARLDFLLEHASDTEDFIEKAKALQLEVDFSGKWATYKLLDKPQLKNTRGRSLDKENPERYNFVTIQERLAKNTGHYSVEDVLATYQEREESQEANFDVQVTLEPWQIDKVTERGIYLTVDFGVENRGQIFVPARQIDQREDGKFELYLKNKDFFYFMNREDVESNRYMTGKTLAHQLSTNNGTIPLTKNHLIVELDDLVEAINFMAEQGVENGQQFDHLAERLDQLLIETKQELKALDEKLGQLHQFAKTLNASEAPNEITREKAKAELQTLGVDSDMTLDEILDTIKAVKFERKILKDKFEATIGDKELYNDIAKTRDEKLDKNDRNVL